MKILLISLNFHPEPTGIGKYNGEMVKFLADHHDEVRVVTAPPYYPAWKTMAPYSTWKYKKEQVCGAEIIRCPIYIPQKISGLTRLFHLLSFTVSSIPAILKQVAWKPDLVLVTEPTLFYAPAAILLGKWSKALLYLHIQDFEVDAAFEFGLLKGGGMQKIGMYFEKWIFGQFDLVGTISQSMLEKLHEKKVSSKKTILFPNWVNTDVIKPLYEKSKYREWWSIAEDKIVVLYSGSIGKKQGLGILLEAADLLNYEDRVLFVICSEGAEFAKLAAQANGSCNIRFFPLQPSELLPDLLGLADIHALIQRENAADLVLPSKLSGMLASGKPVIATAKVDSELGKIISECGEIVEPENAVLLANAIRDLSIDSERRKTLGALGRKWVEVNWDSKVVLHGFRSMLYTKLLAHKFLMRAH